MEKAFRVVEEMREKDITPDVITYTSLIGRLGLVGQPDKARDILKEMKEYGCYPDVAAYNAAIRNFCIAKRIGDAYSLMDEMVRNGLNPNATTYNVFLRSFFWINDFKSSWTLYQRMKEMGAYRVHSYQVDQCIGFINYQWTLQQYCRPLIQNSTNEMAPDTPYLLLQQKNHPWKECTTLEPAAVFF
ncbi:hypothetical protein K7X08_028509 [Anisodus acutangulus]|uniref:Pentatricopeptide repeat-containing protein n=1 Tax=Anisodus acutangulus TaxID=402998 RepID=A0A9Q1M5L4_9SOLA|nr:hypothetical protein K7X08_028509 [Anisodus acutangulus]